MTKGTVVAISQRGMVALQVDYNDYVIIELSSPDEVDLGDVMAWEELTGHGMAVFNNVTKGVRESFYVQAIGESSTSFRNFR